MKISIITVVYNGERFIESALQSVASQDYPDVEHIIVDGASTDRTMEIVEKHRTGLAKVISEKDHGIYDAMNKGLRLATGEIVGILNADDIYKDKTVLSRVMREFAEKEVDSVFGDLVFVPPDNLDKVVRYYRANRFMLKHFRQGDMPPHPTFFVKRELYEKHGLFRTDFRITADFELMVRFLLKGDATYSYIPETLVKMRTGGVSTSGIKSTILVNKEMKRSLEMNGVKTSLPRIYSKYFRKVFQLVRKPES